MKFKSNPSCNKEVNNIDERNSDGCKAQQDGNAFPSDSGRSRTSKFFGSFTTKRIALDAVFTAVYLVFSVFSLKISDNYKLTFDGIAIIMCAFMFGAADALLVALAGSFLSQLLSYGISVTTPVWMASAIARAVICGAVATLKKFDLKTWEIVITVIASSIAVTLFNTLAMYIDALLLGYLTTKYLQTVVYGLLGVRLISSVITAVLFAAVTPPLLYATRKAGIARIPEKIKPEKSY